MRSTGICFSAFLYVFAAGCSSEPGRYPITGSVTINGSPAALTRVTFVPVTPTGTNHGGNATTDEQGNFSITTSMDKKTGLEEGEYRVIFQQSLINGIPTLGGSRGKKSAMAPGETEGIPDDYLDLEKTPIRVTVKKNMEPCQLEIKK